MAHPYLYRAMFDEAAELEDPEAAATGLRLLGAAAARARDAGRLAPGTDPEAVATRLWAVGHGLAMLVLTGVLPVDAIDAHGPALVEGVVVGAGDEAACCRRSIAAGWTPVRESAGG